jgi:hypothetical protein
MFKHKDATKYGIDISKGRVDNLDKSVIRYAIDYKGKKVAVDIGSGQSRLSVVLALLGFDVWCYDIEDHSKYFATLNDIIGVEERIHFNQLDLSTLSYLELPDDIIIAVSQRCLHHLPYLDAKNILTILNKKMAKNGRVYISLSGINSKLSNGYKCANSPVTERFCEVGETGKTIYSIDGNVCLYDKEEARRLVEECNFIIDDIIESDFGNIKIQAYK